MRRIARTTTTLVALTLAAIGCSGGDDGTCDKYELTVDCTPEYAPTFDNIFTNSIAPNCAPPGTACHAAAGARAGLVLEEATASYDILTGDGFDVIAGDPCESELLGRVTSTNASRQMPPGNPLSEGAQCAILQWIDSGAAR